MIVILCNEIKTKPVPVPCCINLCVSILSLYLPVSSWGGGENERERRIENKKERARDGEREKKKGRQREREEERGNIQDHRGCVWGPGLS